jgi:hypothetical protein
VVVDPASNRLQLLDPFAKWTGGDIIGAQVLPSSCARPSASLPVVSGMSISQFVFWENLLRSWLPMVRTV